MRRLVATLVVVLGIGAFAGVLVSVLGGGHKAAPPPPPPAPVEKPLHIVFPEGFTRAEMAQRIAAVNEIARTKRGVDPVLSPSRYLTLTAQGRVPPCFRSIVKRRPREGFLFPATYEFTGTTTTAQLIDDQLQAFCQNWSLLDLAYAHKRKLTSYDVLTIASMIQAEVQAPEERRLVAAVIYNRLRLGMPLGIDATIRYGLGIPGTASLTGTELRNPTPYNTRLHHGLPPTPIGNPGLASLLAAAHPAKVPYLYYLRRKGPPGCPPSKAGIGNCPPARHFFTSSYQAFLAFKARYYG